ncbi:MAG: nucleotide exchange factor GrpE [Treponema sp.]|jgi:molecular chaperone GrpE (heat shock protein)|nr:nucleotide exchange factor GrpE [Treponema sp.]
MLNFEAELNKLLSRETGELPRCELTELASAGRELLAELTRKQAGTSLQIEEIYDLVKDQGLLRETAAAERARADHLVLAAVGLSDLLEDFCAYARRSGSGELQDQAELLWKNAGEILLDRGIIRFGEKGQALDPGIHTVKAGVESSLPRERVVEVLQSGYAYRNKLLRKAAVVLSRGQEPELPEPEIAGAEDPGPETPEPEEPGLEIAGTEDPGPETPEPPEPGPGGNEGEGFYEG